MTMPDDNDQTAQLSVLVAYLIVCRQILPLCPAFEQATCGAYGHLIWPKRCDP